MHRQFPWYMNRRPQTHPTMHNRLNLNRSAKDTDPARSRWGGSRCPILTLHPLKAENPQVREPRKTSTGWGFGGREHERLYRKPLIVNPSLNRQRPVTSRCSNHASIETLPTTPFHCHNEALHTSRHCKMADSRTLPSDYDLRAHRKTSTGWGFGGRDIITCNVSR